MRGRLSRLARVLLPQSLYRPLMRGYHFSLAYLGAFFYRFPSRKLIVIAVTGTKGKSTVVEMIRTILEEAGYLVASASTIQFCISGACERNLFKMTMPGRFFLQQFLHKALDRGCTHAVIEMTSEGAAQFRHKAIELDALVFTNLAAEHIESHGSLEAYAAAKLSLAEHLEKSQKRPRIIVANADDLYGEAFLHHDAEIRAPFSLSEGEPFTADDRGVRFFWRGNLYSLPLPGEFNLKNALAALTLCEALDIDPAVMKKAIENIPPIAGRAEKIERGQPFTVVIDYAHTPDSLKAIYEAFPPEVSLEPRGRRICVLGAMGGGRDKWKWPVMGNMADSYCDSAYITEEDPYDEDPEDIAGGVAKGFSRIVPRIILNRREAIRAALTEAHAHDVVLITGKGTDPYIMRSQGKKEPWSDRSVAEEELRLIVKPPHQLI